MNVKLAAQTLSAKVAHSMKTLPDATKRAEMEETANFVQMMDIWFDTMNTRMGRGKPSIQVFRYLHLHHFVFYCRGVISVKIQRSILAA